MKRFGNRVDLQVSILLAVFVAAVALSCFTVSYSITYNDMKFGLRERVKYIQNFLENKMELSYFSDFESRRICRKKNMSIFTEYSVL